jgi:hypothetical protein
MDEFFTFKVDEKKGEISVVFLRPTLTAAAFESFSHHFRNSVSRSKRVTMSVNTVLLDGTQCIGLIEPLVELLGETQAARDECIASATVIVASAALRGMVNAVLTFCPQKTLVEITNN